MTLDASTALAGLPAGLRTELLAELGKITTNYRERRWEAAELDGGRFAEVAYTILSGFLNGGRYPAKSSKPKQFEDACRQLANADPKTYTKSARVTIPRVLVALYDFRNNRGVGHVGGDVSANHMDAEYVLHGAQWVMAEFVRMFHDTDLRTATATVDALVTRTTPLIWEVDGLKRILDTSLSLGDKTLLLLHPSSSSITDRELAKHLEQRRFADYKRVPRKLHEQKLVEYNQSTGLVTISPVGVRRVEDGILRR